MPAKKIVYIGELPPPYGGVTIKNAMLYDRIFKDANTEFIDVQICKRSPLRTPEIVYRIICGMIRAQTVIIGTGAVWRRNILLRLQKILTGSHGLRKVMMIVMGGQYHEFVGADPRLQRLLLDVGSIWVESEQMIKAFQKMGIKQTYLFPNCRDDRGALSPIAHPNSSPLNLVFYSKICAEKGVEIIIEAYKIWKQENLPIKLYFYGEIADSIKEVFERFVSEEENVHYNGVFDAVNKDVYAELNQYDIMLFPTRWEGEGVAGALVESKMAGITAIVSDWHINSEVVRDEQEGIVLSPCTAETLAISIMALCKDRKKVQALKEGAYFSRTRYCIETYREKLINFTLR